MSIFNDFFSHVNVLIDWVVGTVDHYGCKSSINCCFTFIKARSMVKVDRYRNCDIHVDNQTFYHLNNSSEAAHVTCCAFGYTKNYW
ncbi:hypothetical protein D3C76_1216710 [compost metagenome]